MELYIVVRMVHGVPDLLAPPVAGLWCSWGACLLAPPVAGLWCSWAACQDHLARSAEGQQVSQGRQTTRCWRSLCNRGTRRQSLRSGQRVFLLRAHREWLGRIPSSRRIRPARAHAASTRQTSRPQMQECSPSCRLQAHGCNPISRHCDVGRPRQSTRTPFSLTKCPSWSV